MRLSRSTSSVARESAQCRIVFPQANICTDCGAGWQPARRLVNRCLEFLHILSRRSLNQSLIGDFEVEWSE